jgi:DNA helicase IV
MAHPDLPAEQAHLDRSYDRLDVVRAETQAQLSEAFSERGGTFQSYTERDIRVRNSLNRLEKLQLGREALIFGRIDRHAEGPDHGESVRVGGDQSEVGRDQPGVGGDHSGPSAEETFHIGRLAVSDARHEPLVVDWRAPVAEPFYRATGAHPMGLRRRRHFLTEGRRVVDLEDELFESRGAPGGVEALGLPGSSVLRAALERAHTGRMRDIVATVQAEQDAIIRAPLAGLLFVQGGPGTGKTAVALHRAAYLLYTHRFPLEAQGVLVVGPNPTFLHYIDQVLPSLGETGVELSTATGLYRQARAVTPEAAETARLKGDPRMARFLRRAVHQRQRPLRKPVSIPYGRVVLTLTTKASEEIVGTVKRRSGTHNNRRRLVETLLWQYLAAQLEERSGRGRAPVARADGEVPSVQPEALGQELRRRPEIAEALERMWPRLAPEDLLHDLLGARPLVELAGRGLLSSAEMELLYRPRSASGVAPIWAPADIALLDEASWLLGAPRASASHAPTQRRTYGHIVVDEAQDLSPMELRMVARRSLSGSMTLVGDIAQATGPWAPASWDDVMAHLPAKRGSRQVSLSVSYRAPAEVMTVAGPVLAAALAGASLPEPVRATGERPKLVLGPQDIVAFRSSVALTVREEMEAVASRTGEEDGSVGVLVPARLLEEVRAALAGAGTAFGEVEAGALDSQVTLLALADAKGLEFDSVVVVEPAQIVATPPHGMRALYVALTRCTRRLAIVAREPLPRALQAGLDALEVGLGASEEVGLDALGVSPGASEEVGHPGHRPGEEG